jgi:mono/diheme cytochrome c family protein
MRYTILPIIALASGCATTTSQPAGEPGHAEALAFAQEQCSGCHALSAGADSPNPRAPAFETVANDLGFNPVTLYEFFRDGHDDAGQMRIQLPEDKAILMRDYILSLKHSH